MNILHRISATMDLQRSEQLRELGIKVALGLATFEIDESHPSWPQIRRLAEGWGSVDIITTQFTSGELAGADRFQLMPTWHSGYPQPEEDFGYLRETYDLSAYCPSCDIGKAQKAPFRMKSEPRWGKKNVLQLNWVFDEFFVHPRVWKDAFAPLGIGCSVVVEHRTGNELKTVVQLNIVEHAKSPLATKDYPAELCTECGRKKYLPISRGAFPPFQGDTSILLCRSQESFGSGSSAWNATLADKKVYTACQRHDLAGVRFIPMSAS